MFGHDGLQQPKATAGAPTMTVTDSDLGSGIDEAASAAAQDTSDHDAVTRPAATVSSEPPAHHTDQPTQLASDELLTMKQAALKELSPLVSHLEQTPEEKFRTTMMMIQASDDQSLLKVAYEAAQTIKDEKARAQALLDIVNEINYFTQHHSG